MNPNLTNRFTGTTFIIVAENIKAVDDKTSIVESFYYTLSSIIEYIIENNVQQTVEFNMRVSYYYSGRVYDLGKWLGNLINIYYRKYDTEIAKITNRNFFIYDENTPELGFFELFIPDTDLLSFTARTLFTIPPQVDENTSNETSEDEQ